jgi:hypothetical protein
VSNFIFYKPGTKTAFSGPQQGRDGSLNNQLKTGSNSCTFATDSIQQSISEDLLDLLKLRAMQGLPAVRPFFSSVWIKASFLFIL